MDCGSGFVGPLEVANSEGWTCSLLFVFFLIFFGSHLGTWKLWARGGI